MIINHHTFMDKSIIYLIEHNYTYIVQILNKEQLLHHKKVFNKKSQAEHHYKYYVDNILFLRE